MRECLRCGDLNDPDRIFCSGCGWMLIEKREALREVRALRVLTPVRRQKGGCAWCGKRMPCREHAGLDELLLRSYQEPLQ